MSKIEKLENFLWNNLYKIFASVFLAITFIFLIIIKHRINNIAKANVEFISPLNDILITLVIFMVLILAIVIGFIYLLRVKIVEFSNRMSDVIEKIIKKDDDITFNITKETLLSKLENKLKRLVEIADNDMKRYLQEKDSIKSLISDISHQIKTPIANILMYNDTLIERELEKDQQLLFLKNMKFQVSKLQWLVEALIKMSRLESNLITLNNSEDLLSNTIANALKGVYLKAENKDIKLIVHCPEDIRLYHDKKWTSEALFNIIENAVKYTNKGGIIKIEVDRWELFTKIDIIDTGIGINNDEVNNIFKRFYRSKETSEVEGVGIGLYLANEIITKQGGYIKVKSKKGEGSTFSIFLKN